MHRHHTILVKSSGKCTGDLEHGGERERRGAGDMGSGPGPAATLVLLKELLPLLWIGKLCGWLPFTLNPGLAEGKNGHPLSWLMSYGSGWSILCLVIWSLFAVVSAFAVVIFSRESGNLADPDTVEQLLDMCYHSHITVTSTLCIYHSHKLPEVIETWRRLDSQMGKHESAVPALSAFPTAPSKASSSYSVILWCWLLTGVYLFLAGLGACAYFVIGVGIKENSTSLQEYLDKVSEIYLIHEACEWWTGYFVLFIGFLMEICWSYGDMLILLLSVSLKNEYDRFNRILDRKGAGSNGSILTTVEIEELRRLHCEFVLAVQMTDKLLGQITATSFLCNILYLFCRIYIGLMEDLTNSNGWVVFEATYAFTFLLGRIFVSAIAGAKFNVTKLKTIAILTDMTLKKDEQTYLLLLDRFLQQVISSDVALGGNGFFILNWGFVTKVISALISYEVLILQFSATSSITSAVVAAAAARANASESETELVEWSNS